MNKKFSAKHSVYILDRVRQDLTPARIMDSCLEDSGQESCSPGEWEPVEDETLDPLFNERAGDPSLLMEYASKVRSAVSRPRAAAKAFPELMAKGTIALALIEMIWRKGHFALHDLLLRLDWRWPEGGLGDHSSFYAAVSAAADYIDSLGLRLRSWSYKASALPALDVKAVLSAPLSSESQMISLKEGVEIPLPDDLEAEYASPLDVEDVPGAVRMGRARAHPEHIRGNPSDWLIFIPFDDCDFRLGGSRLSECENICSDPALRIVNPDYFIDCYEVVRELVEDGVVTAGRTVGDGGLMTALLAMAEGGHGADIDLGELSQAYGERDTVRLLFAEVPGVLIQITDADYDYVDAELLLQDVAYYPLGRPKPGDPSVTVVSSDRTGIKGILDSLIRSQSSEGED